MDYSLLEGVIDKMYTTYAMYVYDRAVRLNILLPRWTPQPLPEQVEDR